jgi:hypothetical protein
VTSLRTSGAEPAGWVSDGRCCVGRVVVMGRII